MQIPSSTATKVSGISLDEFYHAFKRVWKPTLGPGGGVSPGVGIAVSGGVDSMALATLCVKLQEHQQGTVRPRFCAFVVDHKARPGSDKEANDVALRLKKMGLHTVVLNLKWPSNKSPAALGSFETQARRLRYRALGIACRDSRVRHLLLAHHSDDQAEHMLMKTAQAGEHLSSVQPMGDSNLNIPECNELHGVHESGLHEFRAGFVARMHGSYQWQETLSSPSPTERSGMQCEDGGVKIYRPLVPFSKERLKATCQEHEVTWVEDQTNHDVTMTRRNAVRALLRDQRLPEALNKERLLITGMKVIRKAKGHQTRAERLLSRTKILTLDLRSGILIVRLPPQIRSFESVPEPFIKNEMSALRTTVTIQLIKLLSIVSPMENIDFSTVHAMIEIVYPELLGPNTMNDREELAFNLGGVLVRRVPAPIEQIASDDIKIRYHSLGRNYAWSFTREPFRRSEPTKLPRYTVLAAEQSFKLKAYLAHEIAISLPLNMRKKHPKQARWSPWRLWDGRYWLRITNCTGAAVLVRPFREADLGLLEESMPSTRFQELKAELKEAAPAAVRWTLPVIAEATESERPLALPTLRCTKANIPQDLKEDLQWEIRYKKIDLGELQGRDNIVG